MRTGVASGKKRARSATVLVLRRPRWSCALLRHEELFVIPTEASHSEANGKRSGGTCCLLPTEL